MIGLPDETKVGFYGSKNGGYAKDSSKSNWLEGTELWNTTPSFLIELYLLLLDLVPISKYNSIGLNQERLEYDQDRIVLNTITID